MGYIAVEKRQIAEEPAFVGGFDFAFCPRIGEMIMARKPNDIFVSGYVINVMQVAGSVTYMPTENSKPPDKPPKHVDAIVTILLISNDRADVLLEKLNEKTE